MAQSRTFITEGDGQFRFVAVPPGTYKLTASLPGFQGSVRDGVVVAVGQNVALPLTLGVASRPGVGAWSPAQSPIVDATAMGTATNFTQDELSKVPNSRDPWALLRTVPGVTVDRVNIAGNETGQQASFVSKGGRQGDAVWTMDGVPITDMATAGASPTYFDYDAFDEIQISTGGNDIKQATGGVGLNFVVKRGTNQLRGTARGYFTDEILESTNLPDELARPRRHARNGRPQPADFRNGHRRRRTDPEGQAVLLGLVCQSGHPPVPPGGARHRSHGPEDLQREGQLAGDVEGHDQFPVLQRRQDQGRPRPWRRAVRADLGALEPGQLLHRQPVPRPVEDRRQPRLLEQPVRHRQVRLLQHRVLAELDRAVRPSRWASARFKARHLARPATTTTAVRSTPSTSTATRSGHSAERSHDFKFGTGWRRTDIYSQTLYPGNGIVAYENSATDFRARVYREGAGTNRASYINAYLGDSIALGRVTLDLGVRYDQQSGQALAAENQPNSAFPALVPGINFSGYDAPFTWKDISPRVGMTYALEQRRQDPPARQLQP